MRQVPFARADITRAEEEAVLSVLRSGWITSGAVMRKFEQAVASYIGGVQSVATCSATAGLHLALEAAGVGPGDEVLLPTWTFTATAEVVRYLGATPVFVDIEPIRLGIDIEDVYLKWTPRCKAIVPVHFAGQPCLMEEIWKFAEERGLKVIEDAAHALGSKYAGQPVGWDDRSFAAVFSFYATKCITTAEGGMVVTHDAEAANRMRIMRLHGISRDVFDRYTSGSSGWEYDVIAPGYKYNMPDVTAALGLAQLQRLDAMKVRRQEIATRYTGALKHHVPVPYWTSDSSCHVYAIQVPQRDVFIEKMYQRGVGCSVHFKPLHRMTYWKQFAGRAYPVADSTFARCVSLPIYSTMTDEDVEYVIEAVLSCLGC